METSVIHFRLSALNMMNEQNQLHVFENNFLCFKIIMALTAEWLSVHSSYSQLCFSTYVTLYLSKLICFLWPKTWLLYFSISYQLLIKPLIYAQAFVFKTLNIFSPVSTSLSHEITIENPLISTKCRLAKFCKVDA